MTDNIEARLAVAETKIAGVEGNLKDIKNEVHDINTYIRNELITKVQQARDDKRDYKQERRDKMKVWGAVSIATISLAMTVFHIIL
jgi:hypothetical protein